MDDQEISHRIAPPRPQGARCPLGMKYLADQLIIDIGELFRQLVAVYFVHDE